MNKIKEICQQIIDECDKCPAIKIDNNVFCRWCENKFKYKLAKEIMEELCQK